MASGGRSGSLQRACGPSNPVWHNVLLLHLHPSILRSSTAVRPALSTAPRSAPDTDCSHTMPGADTVFRRLRLPLRRLLPLCPTQTKWRSFGPSNQAGAVPNLAACSPSLAVSRGPPPCRREPRPDRHGRPSRPSRASVTSRRPLRKSHAGLQAVRILRLHDHTADQEL